MHDLVWGIYNWQTLIAGFIAIIAAILAYRGARIQANTARDVAEGQAKGRLQSYAAMAALESKRLAEDVKDLLRNIEHADVEDDHIDTASYLYPISPRDFLRSEWEQLGSLGPDAAMAVFHLIAGIDEFNTAVERTTKIYVRAAIDMLQNVLAKANSAAEILTDAFERS